MDGQVPYPVEVEVGGATVFVLPVEGFTSIKMEEAKKLQTIQPIVFRQLQNSFEHGRLAHAYL